jgi:hypothetical protein
VSVGRGGNESYSADRFADGGKYIRGMENNKSNEMAQRAAEIQNLPARYVERGAPMDKKAAEDIARGFGVMENDDDGRRVILPMASVGKILRHKGYDFSRIIESIPELYKTSLFGWPEAETLMTGHKEHPNIKEFHQYINKFTDGDGEYYIRFTIKEEVGNSHESGRSLMHSAAISDVAIYKKGGTSQRIWGIDPGEASLPPFVDRKLQEFFGLSDNNITDSGEKSKEKNKNNFNPRRRYGTLLH